MLNIYRVVLIILFFFISCKKQEPLIEVKTVTDYYNLIKIGTAKILEKKNANLLTSSEIMNANYNYILHSTLHKTSNFKVVIILGLMNKSEKGIVLLRTLNTKKNKIISTFLLASYDDKHKTLFCNGFVSKDLILKRSCNDFEIKKTILENGVIQ